MVFFVVTHKYYKPTMSNHSLYSVKDCTVFNQWAKCSSHSVCGLTGEEEENEKGSFEPFWQTVTSTDVSPEAKPRVLGGSCMWCLTCQCVTSVLFGRGQQNACAGHILWMCKTYYIIILSVQIFCFGLTDFFKNLSLILFFSIPFLLSLYFFFKLFMIFVMCHEFHQTNNHCKDEAVCW